MKSHIKIGLVVIFLLMITSCSNRDTQYESTLPVTTPSQVPVTTEITQTPTKSDTQQIIDIVLAYINAESESQSQSSYWNDGFNGYGKFKWGENYPDSPDYQHDGYHIARLLSMCNKSDYPTKIGYDFPKIQDEFAVFDVSFTLDYGFTKVKSVFRFNLIKNQSEWKITDLRLIYTDSPDNKQYVS